MFMQGMLMIVGTTECSVSATILEKGRPALFVSGWFAKSADSCNSGLQYSSSSQVLWVSLASHNQLRGTQLVVEMYSLVVVLVYTAHAHM